MITTTQASISWLELQSLEIGTSIHVIMQSVGTMAEQVTEVSIAASPQKENANEPQLNVTLIVTPPHNSDVVRETTTMDEPTPTLQMNSTTLNEFASMLRKFGYTQQVIPPELAGLLDSCSHEIVMLRRNGADVAFVSATGGKYQNYRRVPQHNGGSCARTVQQATRDQLQNSNDWNKNRSAFVKTKFKSAWLAILRNPS
jgi:hypothetical protein